MPTLPRSVAPLLAAALAATLSLAPTTSYAADPGAAPTVPSPRAATAEAGRGAWSVAALGNGRYQVSWTSPGDLPLTSDRPTIGGPGLAFGPPTIAEDGRTVQAVVTASSPPDPADLDVVLSGDRLDEPGTDGLATAPGRADRAPVKDLLDAPDPATPGPFDTVTSDYTLDPVKLPGMKQPIEMVGHVVEPTSDAPTGERALVLFLHGRHGVCYNPADKRDYSESWPCVAPFEEIPSQLGYDYVQRVLASQGYATVSIRVNGINAQDYRLPDGGADARAVIVQRHLDHWVDLAAEHQVDLDRVVLVGHSRGGEGVDRASIQIGTDAPYRIEGQVLLAPTDFASHTAAYVPTVTVLPYCDGDVYDLQGQKFTDTGRDLAPDDTSLKSSVLVMGANHNFFNTEWTPGIAAAPANDDWYGDRDALCGKRHPDRLTAGEQRDVGTAYIAGAVTLFDGDDAYLPLFDGSPVTVASIGDADVRSHAIGGGRDERRPGKEATPTVERNGAHTRLCAGRASFEKSDFAQCGRGVTGQVTPHWVTSGDGTPTRQFFEYSWTNRGAAGGLRFDDALDLSTDRLELRTIVDSRFADPRLRVRLTDGTGASAVVLPEGGPLLEALPEAQYVTKWWAQTMIVDATGLAGIDLTDIHSVELLSSSKHGRVWVADLASAPSTLPPVPDVRLPQVNIGNLTVDEGDSGRQVARVPFTIDGELTRPARLTVLTAGQARGTKHRYTIDLAPGQTSGYVPVEYYGDKLASYDSVTYVTAWPGEGIATDAYLGQLKVRDDDPQPKITITPVSRRVVEGESLVVNVKLSRPLGYDLYTYGQVVEAPGNNLQGFDVPVKWLQQHASTAKPKQPLWKLYAYVSGQIRAGQTSATLVIPTIDDHVKDGPEKLRLKIQVDRGHRAAPTFTIVDPR